MNKVANFLLDWSQKDRKNSVNFEYKNVKDVLILSNHALPQEVHQQFPYATYLFYSENADLPKKFHLITRSDFTFFGKIKSDEIQTILEKNYDLFIDFNTENTSFLHYLYRRIHAHCSVSHKNEKWTDIQIVKHNENESEYFQKMLLTLQKF